MNETLHHPKSLCIIRAQKRIELLVFPSLPIKNINEPNLYKPKGNTIKNYANDF